MPKHGIPLDPAAPALGRRLDGPPGTGVDAGEGVHEPLRDEPEVVGRDRRSHRGGLSLVVAPGRWTPVQGGQRKYRSMHVRACACRTH